MMIWGLLIFKFGAINHQDNYNIQHIIGCSIIKSANGNFD
jgi:hypothetical protein